MDLGLDGRTFLVTGGTRGVGRAIIDLLLAEGASVATCARSPEACETLYETASPSTQRRLLIETCDVLDAVAMKNFVDGAVRHFGRLDGVVANAGEGAFGGIFETTPKQWQDQFSVKVDSVLNLVRPAVSELEHSDAPRIVIVNGITAHAPEPDLAAVSATRAAVASLARSLALELAPRRILVNCLNLGAISTDRQRARHAASGTSQAFAEWCVSEAARRGVPLGRLGAPHEVAPAAALMLSPLSSYITGTSLDISGGAGGRT